jgi:hypothetical protein
VVTRAVLIFLAVALTAACVHIEQSDYPEYWPSASPASYGCPDLSGLFDNEDLNEKKAVFLANWLVQSPETLGNVERVQIMGPKDGVLAISMLERGGIQYLRREYRQGDDFGCGAGWLERPQRTLGVIGVVQRHVARMTRTVNGDLVVEHIDKGGGVLLVVPMYADERSWHLYRQRAR